jgi:Peptidase family S41
MSQEPFSAFTRKLFDYIDSRAAAGSPVDALILDIRYNGGGSSRVIQPLIKSISQPKYAYLNKGDKLFVITGRSSFSGGVWACIDLYNNTNATFVGEPTGGGTTNRYGNGSYYELPNSKYTFRSSTAFFTLPIEASDAFIPDVFIEQTSSEYFSMKDPVVDSILSGSKQLRGRSIGNTVIRDDTIMIFDVTGRTVGNNNVTQLSDMFRDRMISSKRYNIPGKEQMNSLFDNLKVKKDILSDENYCIETGGRLKINTVITNAITEENGKNVITTKVIATKSRKTLAELRNTFNTTDELSRVVTDICLQLDSKLTPKKLLLQSRGLYL